MSATTAGAPISWGANRYGQLNYYLYAQQSQDIHHRNNQVVGVSFSLPFGRAA
jgi:outer membrane usher protein FimD/PapC